MTKFAELPLHTKVLKAIDDVGYTDATPIQAGAIPPACEGRDVLGIAQTGTGKTAAFTMPMITMLNRGRARARMPRSLVLAPTRELAAQVAENFDQYAKYTKLTKALLIGGVSFKEQDTLIDKGVDVLIATPGRLLDHFERGKLILNDVKVMVVDEADRMLDMGFIPDIERIFGLTPFTRQTLFFSATMAPEIERITNTFLSNPARVEVARQASASENIEQGVVMFKASRKDREGTEKRKVLRKLIEAEGDKCANAIVFCNRKIDVDTVAKSLKKYGFDAAPIHGDLDQSQRTKTLDQFRNGGLRFLIASDVAARGLDVPSVSHVFNFDVPSHAEDYVHRIGRTGRAGRDGKAVMICIPRDEKNFEDIERLLQKEIPRLENPLAKAAPAPKKAKQDVLAKDAKTDSVAKSTEDKPKRTRSRTRKAPAEATTPVEATMIAEVAPEAVVEAPPVVETAPAPEPKQNRTRGGRGRNNDRKNNDRNDNDRKNDRGSKVTGLGDHTPSFIGKSFAERYEG
jgi:superfamily II DNA/RNA helicase